jgi:hypothetical protein
VVVAGVDGGRRSVPRDRVVRDAEGLEQIVRGLRTAFRASRGWILALALLCFAPVPFLQSLRMQLLLRAQEIDLSYRESVKLSFGGNFLNFVFLIGTTAGDVYKAYFVTKHTTRKTEAVMTIVLDRVVGLSGLLVLAAGMSLLGSADPLLRRVGIASAIILAAVIFGAVVVLSDRLSAWVPRLVAWLPLSSQLVRMHAATGRLLRHKRLLVLGLATSVALQFVAVGAVVLCAYALNMSFTGGRIWDYFAFVGAGNVVAAIPVSVLGLGTMEFAYKQFFLGDYGTLAQLLCLALWTRLLQLFWSLPGALITMVGTYRPPVGEVDLHTTPTELS